IPPSRARHRNCATKPCRVATKVAFPSAKWAGRGHSRTTTLFQGRFLMQDAPHISPRQEEPYDAIVVGSGMTGGWAAKELCEQGLKVLVVERGRNVEHGQYPTEWMQPWDFPLRGQDPPEFAEEYPIQHHNYAFSEATKHFFVKDSEHPYLTPADKPFRWIRGYHLGG